MNALTTRRVALMVPRVAGVRKLSADSVSGATNANLPMEIAAGLGLGFVGGGMWMAGARAEFKRMDKFNTKLKESKE
ncbi:Hypothetical Protein FCC1311_109212 [Hondaea fermentalgiana]|uniref:Uncharacterized protein n=1 Tax=Hondaea fermentalgiana TaxID=2315210 RepID=A0A2R5GWJ1_9STRA|nr:Hypothetical Protein FCC1311_109212 [Hondaea fermentalgiana]|eukprot:GBG34699.1 Hypothetical Protein FCC1311_109212 [Hondaea fermentalgiana]